MDIVREAIEEHLKSHTKCCAAAGFAPTQMSAEKAHGIWGQVVDGLKAKGIPLVQILSFLGPILNMIFAGTPIGSIIAQILALLNPPAPVPA